MRDGDKATGGQPYQDKPTDNIVLSVENKVPTLADLGITPIQSYRWQLEASIPEDRFEAFIAETKAATEELTSKSALKLAHILKTAESKELQIAIDQSKGLYKTIVVDPPWPVEKQEAEKPEVKAEQPFYLEPPAKVSRSKGVRITQPMPRLR